MTNPNAFSVSEIYTTQMGATRADAPDLRQEYNVSVLIVLTRGRKSPDSKNQPAQLGSRRHEVARKVFTR